MKLLWTRLFFTLLTITMPHLTNAADFEPRIVAWDVGSFYDGAKGVAILDNGERFATAGGDRVIRIHNSATGVLEKSIIGYADPWLGGGDIDSMTASPDSKQIVVGTNFGGAIDIILDRASSKKKSVPGAALFDRESGKLVRLLDGHTLPANHVFYTNDGKYLISVSQEVLAWDAATVNGTGKPVEMIASTSDRISDIRILWATPAGKANESRILFAREDNMQFITLFEVPSGKYLASTKLPEKPVIIVAKGDRIAVALDKGGILLFDGNLKKLDTLATDTRFTDLDLSGDGQQLVACRAAQPFGCLMGSRNNGYILNQDKPVIATNKPFNALFLNEKRLLLFANDGELRLHELPSGKEERRITPRVTPVGGADLVGMAIIVADEENKSCCRMFNLTTVSNTPCTAGLSIGKELSTSWLGYDIKKVIDSQGQQVRTVSKGEYVSDQLENVSSDSPVGFLENGLVASGGPYGIIDIRTLSGGYVAEMLGHEGQITSIRQRGDLLITTATDRTVRLWDISSLRELPPNPLQIEIKGVQAGSAAEKSGLKAGATILSVNGTYFRSLAEFRELIAKPGNYTFQVKGNGRLRQSGDVEVNKPGGVLGIELSATGEMDFLCHLRPIASVLLTNDGGWALWTEKMSPGKSILDNPPRMLRYTASENGNALLRWRINQGKEKEAQFMPLDRATEYDRTLPGVVAGYAADLAARKPDPLTELFEVGKTVITDRKTGVSWLRNVATGYTSAGRIRSYIRSVNENIIPENHSDWRFPTELEAQTLNALLEKNRRRKGSFLEESPAQLLRRVGIQGASDDFTSFPLSGDTQRAWSFATGSSYIPGKDESLQVLLVRDK